MRVNLVFFILFICFDPRTIERRKMSRDLLSLLQPRRCPLSTKSEDYLSVMLAMYLKYHKAGLTPTIPVTSTAISPVKMSIGHIIMSAQEVVCLLFVPTQTRLSTVGPTPKSEIYFLFCNL
jgi:hypothetical protein